MRKTFMILLAVLTLNGSSLTSATSSTMAGEQVLGLALQFSVHIDTTKGNIPYPKSPVLPPCVYQNGHTLYLVNGCSGSSITLLDEFGDERFSADISENDESIILPDDLSGEYRLQIIRGRYIFYTTIEL